MLFFLSLISLKWSVRPKFPSSWERTQLPKTILYPLTCNVIQPDLKFLVVAGSFMKPESQHRSSSLLCGSPWFSSNCLDRSLLHTLPLLSLQPPIAAASLLLLVFQKASQHGTGCTELKCSHHYLLSLLPRGSNPT